jgi:membrane-bound lytic murein transglycosylase B
MRTADAFRSQLAPEIFAVALCLFATQCHAVSVQRAEVRSFINHMVDSKGFERTALTKLLREAQTQASIIDAMNRPAEKAKLWYEYRQIFLTEKRIRDGIAFWQEHRAELDQAAAQTGVEAQYIVAILGVETQYGRQTGRYRVLDALATLAFDYPERSRFFTAELEQFLLLTREQKIDPLMATGSYAGAMGAPQFMPSSYRRYAVDGSGDGRIDLWTNWLDVFLSVGNYFREHGWQHGEPVMAEAELPLLQLAPTDGRRFDLEERVGGLKAQGVQFDTSQPASAPAFVVAVDRPDGLHWRVGFKNFYVITRYNRSALYAMAAAELAAALKFHVDAATLPDAEEISGAAVIEALP